MSLFTTLREIVSTLRGDDAHNCHGGDSAASNSEDTEPTSEYQAVRAAAKRAAQYEDNQVSENGESGDSPGISHSREVLDSKQESHSREEGDQ